MSNDAILIYVADLTRRNWLSWCPVRAIHKYGDCYEITEENPDPEHIYWEFSTGDVVKCEEYTFAENEIGLVARAKCDNI
jgi:hypothetical protein